MAYKLFLFDADDTLFDFHASERRSFSSTMEFFGIEDIEPLYGTYRLHGKHLWHQFEQGRVTIDVVKTERFKLTFASHGIDLCSVKASSTYLDILSGTVELVDHAKEICEYLSARGEIAIITNGIESVQRVRLQNSGLAPYVSFMTTSEQCGYPKPDARFFEFTAKKAKNSNKSETLVIGDRFEADIEGAHAYGVDACWFNPQGLSVESLTPPKFDIRHLSELKQIIPL